MASVMSESTSLVASPAQEQQHQDVKASATSPANSTDEGSKASPSPSEKDSQIEAATTQPATSSMKRAPTKPLTEASSSQSASKSLAFSEHVDVKPVPPKKLGTASSSQGSKSLSRSASGSSKKLNKSMSRAGTKTLGGEAKPFNIKKITQERHIAMERAKTRKLKPSDLLRPHKETQELYWEKFAHERDAKLPKFTLELHGDFVHKFDDFYTPMTGSFKKHTGMNKMPAEFGPVMTRTEWHATMKALNDAIRKYKDEYANWHGCHNFLYKFWFTKCIGANKLMRKDAKVRADLTAEAMELFSHWDKEKNVKVEFIPGVRGGGKYPQEGYEFDAPNILRFTFPENNPIFVQRYEEEERKRLEEEAAAEARRQAIALENEDPETRAARLAAEEEERVRREDAFDAARRAAQEERRLAELEAQSDSEYETDSARANRPAQGCQEPFYDVCDANKKAERNQTGIVEVSLVKPSVIRGATQGNLGAPIKPAMH